MGGSAEKRAGYREALLNFNFREVSFSSRSNAKIIFKRSVAGKKSTSVGHLGINPVRRKSNIFHESMD